MAIIKSVLYVACNYVMQVCQLTAAWAGLEKNAALKKKRKTFILFYLYFIVFFT